MRRASLLGLLMLLAGPAGPAAAQFGYFGQNKIQYRAFDWRVLRGEHVDLFFYPEEEELARVALAYAEESYRELEVKFTHAVTRRIPLIIYASHQDFEQTNILPFTPPEGLLGVTEFVKRRVALPFTGSYADFRHTLRHELVHVFQLSLSAEVTARYPRQRRYALPLWFTEGIAEFWSAGEDTRDEMILRDLTVSGRLPTMGQLANVYGGIVYPIGGAIHRFLAETYGDWRVGDLYRSTWKHGDFEEAVQVTYGRSVEELSAEWHHWMRRRYYPAVQAARPLKLVGREVAKFALRPVAYQLPGDSVTRVLYVSPHSGYTDVYSRPLHGGPTTVVLKGERTAEFESLHPFDSRSDVREGIVAFGSKYLDRDALFLLDLRTGGVVGRYQFPELVSILSPAWAPDGESVVFSGLSFAGYSDLYRLWLDDGRLERLTSDRYLDADPVVSPDGRTVVFASDRTPFGPSGARNLFLLDVSSGTISYLTYGAWADEAPRWSAADGRIYFSSDRSGAFELYAVDPTGAGERVSDALGGAFDPQWLPEDRGVLLAGFEDLSFHVYFAPAATLAGDGPPSPVALAEERDPPGWAWPELADPRYARADASPYERRFTLDFAAGDAVFAPGLGSQQGAVFLFSDLLSDHLLFVGVSALSGSGLGNLLQNFNGTVVYVNQSRRLNWGVGAFRLRGLFYEGDFSTIYEEESYGFAGLLRYPISRFRRVEGQYTLEHSDRVDLGQPLSSSTTPVRRGWLASNYLSYVKDNTLWLETGPIDGERYNLTGGVVNDLTHGRFDSYLVSADYRRYLRLSLRSAYAIRVFGFHAGGDRPRRVNIGGSGGLRGYPLWGFVGGSRAYLVNQELRFPLTDFLSIGFPFGEVRFPGVQGALFLDAGRAWTPLTEARGVLVSSGIGLRMAVAPPFVFRFDMGYRLNRQAHAEYSLPARAQTQRFVDFFFGFNY